MDYHKHDSTFTRSLINTTSMQYLECAHISMQNMRCLIGDATLWSNRYSGEYNDLLYNDHNF